MTRSLIETTFSQRRRLPLFQSAETAECGLACLAMVAAYHGHDINLNGLRQRLPLSGSGANLRTLMQMAASLDLAPRALKTDLAGLRALRAPTILHWDFNHFVVLESVRGQVATIHDPAKGVLRLGLNEVSKHYTGVLLELQPAAGFERITARPQLRLTSLWSRMEGFWGVVTQILALSIALQVVTFALPFQLQLVVDEGVARADGDILTIIALAFGTVILLQAGLEALRAWALQVFTQLLSFQVIGNIMRHLMRLPTDFFEKRHVGDIMSRIGSATVIQDIFARGLITTVIDGVMAVIAAAILIAYSGTLAAVVLGSVLLNAAIAMALFPAMRRRLEVQLVERAREQSHVMETVRAATVIKIMGREIEREAAWRNLFAGVTNAAMSVGKYNISLAFIQAAITGLQTVVVIYLAARIIIAGDGFSLGMMFAFLSFRQTFSDRVNTLITQAIQFRTLGLHMERLSDVVTAEPDAAPAPTPPSKVEGRIEAVDVSFRYGVGDPLVLRDLALSVAPGEIVGITGSSGGGKTTLMKLLLGLRTPSDGRILLDGRSATPDLWRSWRDRVGVVSQDDRLFSGSIAENIAFFDPDMQMSEVVAAATSAQIHDDITRMPMGYMTLVGDMGSSLSGGQRQRVLLARALYRKPSVLLLDEGTANLDEATEALIANLVAGMTITRIVVAHRPALLERADRVLRVEDGKLVEVRSSAGRSRQGGPQVVKSETGAE